MITFPDSMTATRFPGYYWDVEKKKLYSIKVGGRLREMKCYKANHFNHYQDGYQISHRGYKRMLTRRELNNLELKDSEISIAKSV